MDSLATIGLMSGTSGDGVDGAFVKFSHAEGYWQAQCHAIASVSFSKRLLQKTKVAQTELCSAGHFAEVTREITLRYADVVRQLTLSRELGRPLVVGAHGQTLFHKPPTTWQTFNPALLAAESGVGVVSDFRSADLAAGGQGAPLVPLGDRMLFGGYESRVVINIGGIANLTFLPRNGDVLGFDTGPGNCLGDWLVQTRTGERFDRDGQLAKVGRADLALVDACLAEPFFNRPPPKSTDGPEMIEALKSAARQCGTDLTSADLPTMLATTNAITATSILRAIDALPDKPVRAIAAGGGVFNQALVAMLRGGLEHRGIAYDTTDEFGIPSQAREAVCFAVLAAMHVLGLPGNLPSVTGASRAVVLGSYTPAPGNPLPIRWPT